MEFEFNKVNSHGLAALGSVMVLLHFRAYSGVCCSQTCLTIGLFLVDDVLQSGMVQAEYLSG